ncbi:putative bifunctional diguanylate cyclase/phosphodiesterase [Idiomarina aminovorans]|uniref:putative bifunctional diguanylate cyclase/phosphodiesterase n=1 Tax=Idiomarina aminovorans TaxID=2914829 RepID=UPI00200360B6|nr:EAL domain-containing protein [Idiomarina sp. ATCH4]MCK7459218.1 EAL domain-containing protein [Idiomarina sp. ATCH4]
MIDNNDELIEFADEVEEAPGLKLTPWKILIVDDDPDVHVTTKLALKDLSIEDAELTFVDAYSAVEGLRLLRQENDFSVALIDVVMENDDSGLSLVQAIRDQLHNHSIRLILRTGQPGFAPESDTIRLYDINDYKTKSELTRTRLITSIAIAIRSYSQIKQLEANSKGLQETLVATAALSRLSNINNFAADVITYLCTLLDIEKECLICAALNPPKEAPFILSAAGHFSDWEGEPLAKLPEERVRKQLTQVLESKKHIFDNGICVYFPGANNQALAALVEPEHTITASEQRLLEVFCSNIAVTFENLQLYSSIEQLAFQDSLVKLPNRNGFMTEIGRQLNHSPRSKKALALIDLDGFSYMNSVLDDAFGDEILCAVAQRLCTHLPRSHCIARVGGDIFGVFANHKDLTPQIIESVFSEPFTLHKNESLRISATSGLILVDDDSLSAAELIKNAGVALKQAKYFNRGKTVLFATEQADKARDRMQMLNRLRAAFSSQRLKLHFQPFIRLQDGVTVGAESLLRWETDDGKFIPPDSFIPLAEQSGMIVAIGEWVLSTALRWRSSLSGKVDDTFRVAVNVSLVQLKEDDFVESVIQHMQAQRVAGHQIEIELTESIAAEDIISVTKKLQKLREHNISISMDDFGTGYSSLSVLRNLPFNRLKIDRNFISGSAADQPNYTIARTIKELAGNFKMHTIAEGIETQGQLDALRQTGCEEGQGYFFARPMDAYQFESWLMLSANE